MKQEAMKQEAMTPEQALEKAKQDYERELSAAQAELLYSGQPGLAALGQGAWGTGVSQIGNSLGAAIGRNIRTAIVPLRSAVEEAFDRVKDAVREGKYQELTALRESLTPFVPPAGWGVSSVARPRSIYPGAYDMGVQLHPEEANFTLTPILEVEVFSTSKEPYVDGRAVVWFECSREVPELKDILAMKFTEKTEFTAALCAIAGILNANKTCSHD